MTEVWFEGQLSGNKVSAKGDSSHFEPPGQSGDGKHPWESLLVSQLLIRRECIARSGTDIAKLKLDTYPDIGICLCFVPDSTVLVIMYQSLTSDEV